MALEKGQLSILISAALDKKQSKKNIDKEVKDLITESLKVGIKLDVKSAKSAILDMRKEILATYKQKDVEDAKYFKDQEKRASNYRKEQQKADSDYLKNQNKLAKEYLKEQADIEKYQADKLKSIKSEALRLNNQLQKEQNRNIQKAANEEIARNKYIKSQLEKHVNSGSSISNKEKGLSIIGRSNSDVSELANTKKLLKEINDISFKGLKTEDQVSKINALNTSLAKTNAQFATINKENRIANNSEDHNKAIEKHNQSVDKYINNNTNMGSEFKNSILRTKVGLDVDPTSLKKASAELARFKGLVQQAGKEGLSLGDKFKGAFDKLGVWFSATSLILGVVQGLKQAVTMVQELDKELVNLRMVTGGTQAQTVELLNTYNAMGQKLGATTVEVATSGNEFLRQGKSIADTNSLIETSMVLSKVGALNSAEATKYLTSAMKGYKVEVKDALGIVDKLSAVDLVSATDAGGLAESIKFVAHWHNT